jgi:hypothetical protein
MAVVTQIQIRRGTAAQWTAANPTLASGEWGFETDTNKAKIGNGSTAWNSLSYIITGATGTVTSVVAGTGLSGGTITTTGTIAIDSTVTTLTGTQTLTNKTLTSPTMTAPALGTPASGVLTNATGLPLTTGVTGTLPVANGGTGVTTSTGSGNNVLSTSPTLVSPVLGTPTSGTLTNATGLPLTSGVTGTLPVANGGTGITSLGTGVATFLGTPSSANLAAALTDETGTGSNVFGTNPTITGGTFADAVIRQSLLTPTFTTNAYTLVLTDQGDILLTSNGATAGTVTIPTNASVAFPTGTQITLIQTGAGQITIQGAGGVTVASTGATSTAPKLRAINSSATCIKTGTDTWYVIGDIS